MNTDLSDQTSTRTPLVSAIVATYNEERHIGRCLAGLLGQTLSPDLYEIIVVDGGSDDRTRDIIQKIPGFGRQVRLLDNPRRFQVFAWNLGVREARGEYVVFISAHTEYAPDYLCACLEAMERTQVDCVGAVQVPIGTGILAEAIAWALQSPLGIGNAHFRYAKVEREVESVFGGFFRRDTFLRFGGYDETNLFDEDGDLSYRIRAAGGRIVVCPSIRVRYHVRQSLGPLARQMFRYGFWRRQTQVRHGWRSTPLRVFAPPLLVGVSFISLTGAVVAGRPVLLSVLIPYVVFLGVAAYMAWQNSRRWGIALLVPVVLATMHVSYGLGYLVGVSRSFFNRGGM
jgi:succinoglycan biosynthesis protein ExoA